MLVDFEVYPAIAGLKWGRIMKERGWKPVGDMS